MLVVLMKEAKHFSNVDYGCFLTIKTNVRHLSLFILLLALIFGSTVLKGAKLKKVEQLHLI